MNRSTDLGLGRILGALRHFSCSSVQCSVLDARRYGFLGLAWPIQIEAYVGASLVAVSAYSHWARARRSLHRIGTGRSKWPVCVIPEGCADECVALELRSPIFRCSGRSIELGRVPLHRNYPRRRVVFFRQIARGGIEVWTRFKFARVRCRIRRRGAGPQPRSWSRARSE